jgi:hypothetical protein
MAALSLVVESLFVTGEFSEKKNGIFFCFSREGFVRLKE